MKNYPKLSINTRESYNFLMSESSADRQFFIRKDYFTQKANEAFSQHKQNFKDFVGNPKVIYFGDNLLSHRLSTGYNFATYPDFPINSKDSLILYSVYIQRRAHFGELLARMEQEKIIEENDITFGAKASKILDEYGDPELITSDLKMADGKTNKTQESADGVIIFHPPSALSAVRIARFLVEKAPLSICHRAV